MMKALLFILVVLCSGSGILGQTGSGSSVWGVLSLPSMDPAKSAFVENIEILRDRVHITLTSGTIQFLRPANGVVFGAVFHGSGRLQAEAPNATERQQLDLLAKQAPLDMAFSDATFSFTDDLFDEVRKQVNWKEAGGTGDELYIKRQREREDEGAEYLPRLLQGVMSPDPKRTAYFLADLKTKEKGWVEVRMDATQPEELSVGRWVDVGTFRMRDYWMVWPAGGRDPRHVYDDPSARQDFLIPDYQLSTTVTDGAELIGTARVTVQPRYSGERVLLFQLDSYLRVSSVKDGRGRNLEYLQARERKEDRGSHGRYVAVVLAEATQAGQSQVLEFQYSGKHVVVKVGDGNYFCESFGWYPAAFFGELGINEFAFRSNFDLTFRSPKKYQLVATGHKTSETTDGKELITTWKSDIPLAVAGFVFGDYKVVKEMVGDIEVQVYANNQPDELLQSIQRHFDDPLRELGSGSRGTNPSSPGGPIGGGRTIGRPVPTAAIGNLTPASLGKTISGETANTLRVFQSYFGPYPYKQLVVTNIIGSYGQGWPGLLYLGWFTFLDSTQQHALGIRNLVNTTDFFRGHESSHQWWGHRVGWKSYHDQWLSEGFAEFSGKLYVQYRESSKEFLTQFKHDKEILQENDIKGHTVEGLGPIWLGQRIMSSETSGTSYQNLIYSKGGYVLQMIRNQMQDPRSPDPEHVFKETMQDYCKTFDNQAASTEDFKAIVEKHMTKNMDLDGNHKMDWFFNQYVYGTGIPHYSFHASLSAAPDGKTSVVAELDRTGVPDTWKDVIPIYAHAGDKVLRLGTIAATHPKETLSFILPGKADKITVNEYEDVLADVKQ